MRLFRRHILLFHLLALAAVCPSVTHGQEYSSRIRNREKDQAFRTLTDAKIFNLGGAGFGLAITPEEKAFRLLLNSGNSGASFQRLLREGNPEGQLFALYGLYLEDREAFKSEVERLKHDDGPPERWDGMIFIEQSKIRTAVGCIFFRKDRHALLEQMANGDFDQAFKALNPTLKFNPTLKY